MGRKKRQPGSRAERRSSTVNERPRSTQAEMLIARVPHGNLLPNRAFTVDPTQNRAVDPSAPPIAINKYLRQSSLKGNYFPTTNLFGLTAEQ